MSLAFQYQGLSLFSVIVAAFLVLWGLGSSAAAQEEAEREGSGRPHISSVSPEPVTGSIEKQWLTLNGSGFDEEFTVRLRAEGVNAHIEKHSRLDFISAEQVRVEATFGNGAVPWSVQVLTSEGVVSNIYTFNVVAPAPQIEVMRPIERTQGQSSFTLTVYGNTISPHSVIRWNGRTLKTKPEYSSENPNALVTGLKAEVPAASIAEVGRNEVRVYTPPPGGGLSPPVTLFAEPRPFYRTTWFYLLCVVGAALVGWAVHWYRVKNLREKVLKRKIEARTQSLLEEKQKTEAQAAQLREQAELLQELDRAKSRFFANLSHKFRTPLTMIQGPLRDVLDGTRGHVGEEAAEQLDVARRNARRLERLIDQLLDLARLETGQMQLQPGRGDLVAFVKRAVRAFVPLSERKGITLQCCADAARLETAFDAKKLRTVLDNLLSNALKFTPEGGDVVVTVAEAEARALIHVQDTGVGIPEDQRAHIFNRFHWGHGTTAGEREGISIGLSIAKKFVDLHGGTIRVESEAGAGSTFTVALPLVDEGDGQGSTGIWGIGSRGDGVSGKTGGEAFISTVSDGSSARQPTTDDEQPTILVVEDNPDVRTYLRIRLSAYYHVVEACNGAKALEKVREERPDLVLSDIMMPEMDGAELCRTLKTDEDLKDLPVVLLTARAGEKERVEGLETGADDYIEKPFSVAELKARVQNLIRSRRELRTQYRREVVLQPEGITITPEDEAFYERACAVVEKYMGDSSFTMERFAGKLAISKSTLGRKLKAATGLTPAQFVRRMRLERAAQLLEQDPGRRVFEVAEAVGYDHPDHFSKLFREHFGARPSAYPADDA